STEPSATAPGVPPVAATLPGFDATSWHGVFAPAGVPRPIVDALAAEVKRIFSSPEVQKSLFEVGAVPSPMTPGEFASSSPASAASGRRWYAPPGSRCSEDQAWPRPSLKTPCRRRRPESGEDRPVDAASARFFAPRSR